MLICEPCFILGPNIILGPWVGSGPGLGLGPGLNGTRAGCDPGPGPGRFMCIYIYRSVAILAQVGAWHQLDQVAKSVIDILTQVCAVSSLTAKWHCFFMGCPAAFVWRLL